MKLEECPVNRTLRYFDGRWKPLILNELKGGPIRAGELMRKIPEASEKMLTQQLREPLSRGRAEVAVVSATVL